jgi:hypothetical protein
VTPSGSYGFGLKLTQNALNLVAVSRTARREPQNLPLRRKQTRRPVKLASKNKRVISLSKKKRRRRSNLLPISTDRLSDELSSSDQRRFPWRAHARRRRSRVKIVNSRLPIRCRRCRSRPSRRPLQLSNTKMTTMPHNWQGSSLCDRLVVAIPDALV